MASSKSTIDIVIGTVCKFTGIDAAKRALKSLRTHVGDFTKTVATNLTNIKSGFEMMGGVVRTFAGVFTKAIKAAFSFESAKTAFTGLLNSVEKSAQHIEDLRKFASQTPLTFEDLQQASKLLLSFGASVDDIMPSLKMLGDISMGNAQKFQGLALVFAQVKAAGRLMGQDLLQMINQGFNPLTVIAQKTGKSVSELKDIMSNGGISFEMVAEAMRLATTEGGLFNNAMEGASKTANGLMSTLQDNWTDALRTFGAELMDVAKGGLQWCINKLHELKESGAIKEWAEKSKTAIYSVIGAFDALSDSSTRGEVWGALKDVVVGGFELAANKAVEVLIKAAPIIGGLIASGFTNLKDLMADALSPSAARQAAREQLGDSIYHEETSLTPNMQGQLISQTRKVENADAEEKINALAEKIQAEMRKQKAEQAKREAESLSAESIDEIKKKLAELKERREKIVVEVEESRETAEPTSHPAESVAVTEQREQSESLDHLAESVDVIENRVESAPTSHPAESVAVTEQRDASSVSHPAESVTVRENYIHAVRPSLNSPDADGSVRRESPAAEIVNIDAEISAYEKKLKTAESSMSRFERGLNTLKRFGERALKNVEEEAERIAREEKSKGTVNTEIKPNAEVFDNIGAQSEAERKAREKMEADLHRQRVAYAKAELQTSKQAASAANNAASRAQTEFDRAFGMYRSEDHGAAQIAEERDYAADYKQLQKDASRYGGKWRIDELASLMAAGDTKGQAAKLEEWRKSSSFTPEVESMVRAAAADQTKTTAEAELRQINTNTKNLADKLDQLLQVK